MTADGIVQGVEAARRAAGDRLLILAGKMHAAGSPTDWSAEGMTALADQLMDAGTDGIVIPAPGTVPGIDRTTVREVVRRVHERGGLAMVAVGTSQEGADVDTIRRIALASKEAGADMLHLGDAGTLGMAEPENLLAASIALRGRRHAWRRMAASPLR